MDVSQEEFEIMVADAEGILISPAGSVVPGVVPRTDNKPVFVSVSGGSILMVRGAVGIIPVVLDDVRVSVRGSASEREAKLRVFCEDVAGIIFVVTCETVSGGSVFVPISAISGDEVCEACLVDDEADVSIFVPISATISEDEVRAAYLVVPNGEGSVFFVPISATISEDRVCGFMVR